MNWSAIIGIAIFGGLLFFGFGTGTMPVPRAGASQPDRIDNPVKFWIVGAFYAAMLAISFGAFVGLLR
jgi:hypothetical protein